MQVLLANYHVAVSILCIISEISDQLFSVGPECDVDRQFSLVATGAEFAGPKDGGPKKI